MENKLDGKLRAGFKQFNKFMLLLWRLGLGPWVNMWPDVSGRIMVLVHIGRKSGQRRLTPVNYATIDGDIFCVAGFGSVADWYCNIKANSKVEVMLPDGWWEGKAEEIVDISGSLPILRQVLVASGIVAPMMGVQPKKMPDAELEKITASYKLVRIRRTAARTGPGGPGDLAWFWPAATFVLAGLLWRKKNRLKTERGYNAKSILIFSGWNIDPVWPDFSGRDYFQYQSLGDRLAGNFDCVGRLAAAAPAHGDSRHKR